MQKKEWVVRVYCYDKLESLRKIGELVKNDFKIDLKIWGDNPKIDLKIQNKRFINWTYDKLDEIWVKAEGESAIDIEVFETILMPVLKNKYYVKCKREDWIMYRAEEVDSEVLVIKDEEEVEFKNGNGIRIKGGELKVIK